MPIIPIEKQNPTFREEAIEGWKNHVLGAADKTVGWLKQFHAEVGALIFNTYKIQGESFTVQDRLDLMGTNAATLFTEAETLREFVNSKLDESEHIPTSMPKGAKLEFNEDGSATYTKPTLIESAINSVT